MATLGLGSVTGCSSSSTRPRVGARRPARQRSSVVLPQPDGPTMHSVRLAGTSRLRSWKATTAPAENVRVARSRRILGEEVVILSEAKNRYQFGPGNRSFGAVAPQDDIPSVPARVAAPGAAVALDRLIDEALICNLSVGGFVLRLQHGYFHFLVDCGVDELLGH